MSPKGGAERVKETVDGSSEAKPEPPRPLMRELPSADPFPVDALGTALAPVARAIHDRVQAPLAICAQAVLAAATLAVQGHADIELPIGEKRVKPISSYFFTVAETGERKTEADYQACWPIRQHEKNLRQKYDAQHLSYMNDKEAWDKARVVAVKKAKGNREAARCALDQLGPPPEPPLCPMLTSTEPTLEGLIKQFPTHPSSMGIYASEGGQFIGGHGMNEENKLKTASGLSSLWDGDPTRRVRAGDGAAVFPGRRLSSHLMAQPDVAGIVFRDGLLAAQGLLSRVLVTAPLSTIGTRKPRPEQTDTNEILRDYGARLLRILRRPLPLADGKSNELEPPSLPLSRQAIVLWNDFVAYIEDRIGRGGELEPIKGLAAKLPEHAARLAAVLTLVGDIEAKEVNDANLKNGIKLAEHYAAEALRLFQASKIDADLLLAQRLLDWLRRQKEAKISLPDIYQRSLNAIGDKATAKKIVAILADHGWLIPIAGGAEVCGTYRREVWEIVR